ncbi:HAD domain-containing protein [soil metagenome]
MNICYLDFDAVLHDGNVLRNRSSGMTIKTPGRSFFEWMPILEDLLAPYPDLKIVLSTTWVRELGFNEAKHELSASLQDRVIGATFLHPKILKAEFDTMPRGMQILGDVERRKPSQWFALDDDAFGWPARHKDKLIQTKDASGLSDPAVQEKVRERLAQMYPATDRD